MIEKKTVKPFDDKILITAPMIPKKKNFINHLDDIIKRGWITNNGVYHNQLEGKLKEYLKLENISLINNGTTALLIALKAMGIKGKMITTPFTFAATAQSLFWMNIEPVFVDVDDRTMNIDPSLIEDSISNDVTGILPVHVFGNPCDVKYIDEIAQDRSLATIYDGAHTFGTEINGVGIGNYGDLTIFSFHATKLFNTIEGGAISSRDEDMKRRIDIMKNFGIKNEECVELPGINGKLNELQSAWGLANLENMESERRKRENIKIIYEERLSRIKGITLNHQDKNVRSSLQYFVIRVDKKDFGLSRDELDVELRSYNVYTRRYFYPLCSNFGIFRNNKTANVGNLRVANQISEEVLCLPFHGHLGLENVERICDIIEYIQKQNNK